MSIPFYNSPAFRSNRLVARVSFCVAALLVMGCREQPQIREYSVPKKAAVFAENHVDGAIAPTDHGESEAPASVGEPTDRMLAAIIPHGDKAWFFKLTGPIDSVAKIDEPFHDFVRSVHFDETDEANPQWDKPEEWKTGPAAQMRFATLLLPAASGKLELAVSSLGYQAEDRDGFLLANVNRWRKQMSLPDLTLLALPEHVKEEEIAGAKVTFVDLTGRFGAGAMRPPFAGGTASPHPPLPATNGPAPSEDAAASKLKFETPEGWQPLPASGFRKAAFAVEADGKKIEITIIDLAAAAGELLPNVNRWRGQVHLDPIDEAQLANDAQEIEGANWQGKYFILVGPETDEDRQTILGVITVFGEQSWFIKLNGPSELAQREQENFEKFARSVQF